uniref:Tail fiber assembly protein n=1 Tax=viral metagenome TaxID=1070528 RepID=A0A6H1ZCV6_9ZZZZ
MEKIIYRTDKGISIVNPTGEFPIEDVIQKSVPKDTDYWIVDEKDIPKDRSFRDAWEWDGAKIKIDNVKKQVILDKKAEKDAKLNAKQEAIDSIDSATTIPELIAIVKKVISVI